VTESEKRTELFVATWKTENSRAKYAPTYAMRTAARANLASRAKRLQHDPQLN
jgi:hypothetical protein